MNWRAIHKTTHMKVEIIYINHEIVLYKIIDGGYGTLKRSEFDAKYRRM